MTKRLTKEEKVALTEFRAAQKAEQVAAEKAEKLCAMGLKQAAEMKASLQEAAEARKFDEAVRTHASEWCLRLKRQHEQLLGLLRDQVSVEELLAGLESMGLEFDDAE